MTSFFASDSTADLSADSTIDHSSLRDCGCLPTDSVSAVRHGTLTADQREASIKLAGHLVERHMRLANEDPANYFLHRGNADRARLSMEALIKGRDAGWKRQEHSPA